MKKWGKILYIFCLCLCLSGCGRKPAEAVRVVSRVDVICQDGGRTFTRSYTKPHKIRQVLNYLRLQQSLGTAEEDPERLNGPAFCIVLEMSDGSSGVYYQRSGRYLSKKYHPWQRIDPKKAAAFFQTLQVTPTDIER